MKFIRKSVSVILSLILIISLFTILPPEAFAAQAITINNHHWDSSDKTAVSDPVSITEYTELSRRTSNKLASGYYTVKSDTTVTDRLHIANGETVGIYLGANATLTSYGGIRVDKGATLNIYAETSNSGKLLVNMNKSDSPDKYCAMIGSEKSSDAGVINFHSGAVEVVATHGNRGACIGGGENGSVDCITVWDGDINCHLADSNKISMGAGIGSGLKAPLSWKNSGEGVRIYGGKVYAESGSGAGIGNGDDYEKHLSTNAAIAIYGGEVTAKARRGAGIGGGCFGYNGPINISGGEVTAISTGDTYWTNLNSGAAIGSGEKGDQNKPINISGGTIIATSAEGAGIGGGDKGDSGTINITGGNIVATSLKGGAGIGGGCKGNNGTVNISNAKVVALSKNYETGQEFEEAVDEQIKKTGWSSYPQAYYTSALKLVSLLVRLFGKKYSGSGIGGGHQGAAGTITIDNSNVTAESGKNAASIGTGDDAPNGGTITIRNHSTVTATSGSDAAGIGGGNETMVDNIYILGNSTVKAYGGNKGAGIGSGDAKDNGYIRIVDSDVEAYGGTDGAGIGGGEGGHGGSIYIYDSNVHAEGKRYGAGIGGGEDEGVRDVTIGGESSVEAIAGSNGNCVAIGHGDYNKFWAWLTGNYPSNGTLSMNSNYKMVKAGANKDSASLYTKYTSTNIWDACRNNKYAKVFSCKHNDGAVLQDLDGRYHGYCCSYCGKYMYGSEGHQYNSNNECSVCGASAEMVNITFVEKNNSGEVRRTVTRPRGSAYKLPEPENTPDGMRVYCWKDNREKEYQIGDEIVCNERTYTAVYMPAVETTYIDENGIQQSVTAIRLPKEDSDLYAGWYIADYDTSGDDSGASYWMYGDVNVIIADDVTWSNTLTKFYNFNDRENTFSLYGQKKQNGTFEYGGSSIGRFYNFNQYGGILNTGALVTENNFTFAGGNIKARSVTAPNTIQLGWTRWEDSINISHYYKDDNNDYPKIVVAEGRPLINDNNNIFKSGELNKTQIHSIQGHVLSPYPDLSYGREPQWTWSDDGTEAEALFTCPSNRDEDVVLKANVTYTYDGLNRVSTAAVKFRNTTYTDSTSVQLYWNVNKGSCEHGKMEFSSNLALTGSNVKVTVTPDEGYALKSLEVTPGNNSSIVEVDNNEFTMPACNVTVDAEFVPVVPGTEPYIDENGEYHLGSVKYAEIGDEPFSVNDDGTIGELLDSIELSYFDFALINNDSEYQIKYYTGPTDISELVIPKTYNGKPVTVLGVDNNDTFINYGENSKTQFDLVLNENICEIKNRSFYTMWVKKVEGNTSGLNKLGSYAFSWANSPGGYTLDIKLDYTGRINTDDGVFNNMNVTARMKHTAYFDKADLKQNTLNYILTDEHIYGEPEWNWANGHSSATAVFTCTDSRCKHKETVSADITAGVADQKTAYIATVVVNGLTYTDTKYTDIDITPMVEPRIDENGEYILGVINHYEHGGKNYAVNEDGSVGAELSDISLSYFDFSLINNDSEYQINYYTGPTENLTELIIPKTYKNRRITTLGKGSTRLFETESPEFTLVLNENITEIKSGAFSVMKVKKVTGDTSNLSSISGTAFAASSKLTAIPLDIRLDYPGQISESFRTFDNRTVTMHLKHSTTFTGNTLLGSTVIYDFTDDHVYGEPVWIWADDYGTASAKFTCTDSRCKHEETVNAEVKTDIAQGRMAYIATVKTYGKTYTDTKLTDIIFVSAVEPRIDENGAYILGNVKYYEHNGKKYAVNEDNSVGEELSDISLSYFDFSLINDDSEYQVNRYTGPTDNLTKLVIPKTYQNKPITVLGNDSNVMTNAECSLTPMGTPSYTLVLNENIREIKYLTFFVTQIKAIEGDTSNLSKIGYYAFRLANNNGGKTLDIRFDHEGTIECGARIFDNVKVTARVKHATKFTNENNFNADSIDYIFTDDHVYGEPVWTWADDYSTASAKFTCTDSRCKHEETVNASVISETSGGFTTNTATVTFENKIYTDVKTQGNPLDALYNPSITAVDALRLDKNLFALPGELVYTKAKLLGVQKKETIKTDTAGTGLRFVAELSSEYVNKENVDYGFEIVKTSKNNTAEFNTVGGFGIMQNLINTHSDNIKSISCKNTDNNIVSDYGNRSTDTTYKYVTLAINNIDADQGIAVRFYVEIDGVRYYSSYTNSTGDTFRGCCASCETLVNAVG